jgi:hypothetical protein
METLQSSIFVAPCTITAGSQRKIAQTKHTQSMPKFKLKSKCDCLECVSAAKAGYDDAGLFITTTLPLRLVAYSRHQAQPREYGKPSWRGNILCMHMNV